MRFLHEAKDLVVSSHKFIMKKEALEYLERVKETTQKSCYMPHGGGIDDMMVRENYDVQSVPYDKAVYAVEIANKGMTAIPTKVRTEKKYDNDVEYVRKDAFIEKASEYLHRYLEDTKVVDDYRNTLVPGIQATYTSVKEFIDDFKNHMK